ncbi:hypothetical protein ASPBRDRAFT_35274 [Aspergillus brasiliensis CBS 101740]|uniref:Uncharacterized protein n=1 Tax=Aspergillus brasiliensis (strain CBS 101740 / IMI 381727 / IBT 21946) TaxID=767769 RepID=A0A1L9U3N1_ASPBC|nr:hypothetical protein ASPBRDRAFT_35274 [Aspergillus brasiliensis CBS 101740]
MSTSILHEIAYCFSPVPVPKLLVLKALIEQKCRDLSDGRDEDCYLSFNGVNTTHFDYIRSHRHSLGAKHVRFTHIPGLLILKVPSEPHERSQAGLGHEIFLRLRSNMGVCSREVSPVQGATYLGQQNITKEADLAYKNTILRSEPGAWPHWVVEGGMTMSIQKLRTAAKLWVNVSEGDVRLVILVGVRPSRRQIHIETWVPEQTPMSLSARKQHDEVDMDFSVDPPTYRGPPALVFEFSRLLGRAPIPPGEQDVMLSRQDLLRLGRAIWWGI